LWEKRRQMSPIIVASNKKSAEQRPARPLVFSRFFLLRCALGFLAAASLLTGQTVTLGSSPNPSIFGAPVTLTATISGGGAGKVTFYDGLTVLGTSTISGNTAVLSTTSLPSGNRSLRAFYLNAQTTSNTVVQQVNPIAASTQVPGTGVATQSATLVVASGDFNGDGKTDIVVAMTGLNALQTFLGDGSGGFQPAPCTATVGISSWAMVTVSRTLHLSTPTKHS
jgi:hypothetical protein